jgi:predicted O-methyltransferase YrrM
MSRTFLDRVAPFPGDNPMGWGVEMQWAKQARDLGVTLAIIDACPVTHAFRPVGERYAVETAVADMERFWDKNGLDAHEPAVLREYRRIYETREDYLAACPCPADVVAHGRGSDAENDLPLLWSVASLVQPELTVELGTRQGTSVRVLAHAAGAWGGTVVTADPLNMLAHLDGVPCQFVNMSGEELFQTWSAPVQMLFIDTDPHSYRQTRRWLDTWVTRWLVAGGVAVFHDVVAARPEIQVAAAVRDWLREQPPAWHWQEFPGTSGLGLLWRLEKAPDFATSLNGVYKGTRPHPVSHNTRSEKR